MSNTLPVTVCFTETLYINLWNGSPAQRLFVIVQVLALQTEHSSLHKRIADCEGQLPKLQEAKKTAVNGKCTVYM